MELIHEDVYQMRCKLWYQITGSHGWSRHATKYMILLVATEFLISHTQERL